MKQIWHKLWQRLRAHKRALIWSVIAIESLLRVVAVLALDALESEAKSAKPVASASPRIGVSALGRIEPESGVIRVAAPSGAEGARIGRLLVREGQRVAEGSVIAEMDDLGRCVFVLTEAQRAVEVARARVEQVKVPAKRGELGAQQAAIARVRTELLHAEAQFARQRARHADGYVSAAALEVQRVSVDALRDELQRAQATLAALREVRPVDTRLAEAELERAIAAAQLARQQVEEAKVKAPFDATVIKLHARAGETVGAKGIVELADTARMIAVVEVYEADVGRVRVGERVCLHARSHALELAGTVTDVGLQIGKGARSSSFLCGRYANSAARS